MPTAGFADLIDSAAHPAARPSAAQLLPYVASAEGLPRLERMLAGAAEQTPEHLAPASRALVAAGGKRVRPLLLLLSARAAAPGRRARGRVALALVSELVHSATLLHDDVIDDGLTRRGIPAPRVAYGNGVSVLAGDWMLAQSLDFALRSKVPGAVEALVQTLKDLVAGESRQLALRGSVQFGADDALHVARLKTGALFAFCGEAGALAARASPAVRAALREFGGRAGTAFQIADDLLDFESDAATLGKAVLADVAEGKPSLPVGLALDREPRLRDELTALLAAAQEPEVQGTVRAPEDPVEIDLRARARGFAQKLGRTGALVEARRLAVIERDAALAALDRLPDSPTRQLLALVAGVLLDRKK